MLNIILLLILVAIIVLFLLVSRQPASFKITRTGLISAKPAEVFPHVNGLRKWDAWSPWAKLDPNATNSFEGPAEGIGAKMSWAGNNQVGVGSMTIMESRPDEYIQMKLEFQKPMRATNTAEFTFKPEGDQTSVTWSMIGTNNFVGKLMNIFMNCDKMVGGQFEKGLASLKSIVEAGLS